MEDNASTNTRWDAIKQYRVGYLIVAVLTMAFIYFLMPSGDKNTGEVIGFIWGGSIVLLFIPALFAWLGKSDTPKRRFALFLALWIIILVLAIIGTAVG